MLLFQVFLNIIVNYSGECELIGEGYPRHLNTFSDSLIAAVYYTRMLCIVAIVDCTHVHHVVH